MDKQIFKQALKNSAYTVLYIVLLSAFFRNVTHIFPPDQKDNILAPIFILTLFVVSAGITSSLVFGKPVLWYLDGRKKEAVTLLVQTLLSLFIFVLIVLIVLLAV